MSTAKRLPDAAAARVALQRIRKLVEIFVGNLVATELSVIDDTVRWAEWSSHAIAPPATASIPILRR